MVLHPNAGAVLVVGLGCENNQPDVFREFLGEYDSDRVKFMVTQKVSDEYEEGMKLLRELYAKASKNERVDVPLSELRVGLKCAVPTDSPALRLIRCWACSPTSSLHKAVRVY